MHSPQRKIGRECSRTKMRENGKLQRDTWLQNIIQTLFPTRFILFFHFFLSISLHQRSFEMQNLILEANVNFSEKNCHYILVEETQKLDADFPPQWFRDENKCIFVHWYQDRIRYTKDIIAKLSEKLSPTRNEQGSIQVLIAWNTFFDKVLHHCWYELQQDYNIQFLKVRFNSIP